MRGHLFAASLITIILIGCSEDDPAPSDPVAAKFDGQLVALMPFDASNPACKDDPLDMAPETLSMCAAIEPSRAKDVVVTMDLDAFDPRVETAMFVFRGPALDPNDPDGWIGIVGLGPLPKEGTTGPLLTNDVHGIHPQFVMAAPLLYYGATALFAAGVAWYGGKAIVAVGQKIADDRRSQQLTEQAQRRLIEKQSQVTKKECEGGYPLICPESTQKDLQERKDNTCKKERACNHSHKCDELQDRISNGSDCLTARDRVTNACCGGKMGPNHQGERDSAVSTLENCKDLFGKYCK